MPQLNIEYLQLVTRHQAAISAYIRSIAPGLDPDDVLQETNLVLWDKADQFERGTNFKAFAFRIAYFKSLEALRAKRLQEWLQFDSDLLERIAAHRAKEADAPVGRQHALRQCLAKLRAEDRDLIQRRYVGREAVRHIARDVGRSEGAMQQVFFRLRTALRRCIEGTLAAEGHRTA